MLSKLNPVLFVLLIGSLLLAACQPAAIQPEVREITKLMEGEVVVVTATPDKAALPAGSVAINGAGATFPLPIYTEWIFAYQYVDPSVILNYQGTGSGGGKRAIIDNTIDFAGTDSLLKAEEYEAGGDLQMLPMLAGAVVPIYNIEGLEAEDAALVLDRQVLTDIYLAKIRKWNDPAIVALNPDLAGKLPNADITAAHRSDGSGTTEIFTKALSAFSEEWKENVGAGASVEWPVALAGMGIGGKGNPGVAAVVQNTPNSIGYVELSYAVSNNIPFAKMINKAGNTVEANAETLQAAMNDFAGAFDENLTANIVDGDGANTWPIAGYTYLIIRMESMEDCVKAAKLMEYINWTLTDAGASKRAADLGYAVLPDAVRQQVQAKLAAVTCQGEPVFQP